MVTARRMAGFDQVQRRKMTEFLETFARKDILLYKHSALTRNAMGRVSGFTEDAAVTIIGDLQFVTVQDKQLIELGYAKLGDGIFYTTHDVDIDAEDQIVVDGVYWELSRQVEGEQTLGNTIYQAWVAVRKPEV